MRNNSAEWHSEMCHSAECRDTLPGNFRHKDACDSATHEPAIVRLMTIL
jgi:hypothetical protein